MPSYSDKSLTQLKDMIRNRNKTKEKTQMPRILITGNKPELIKRLKNDDKVQKAMTGAKKQKATKKVSVKNSNKSTKKGNVKNVVNNINNIYYAKNDKMKKDKITALKNKNNTKDEQIQKIKTELKEKETKINDLNEENENLYYHQKYGMTKDDINAIYQKEVRSSLKQRKLLSVGDEIEIYSNSSDKWYIGEITKIYNDADGEWLECSYACSYGDIFSRTKPVQRSSVDIKPLTNNIKKIYNKQKEEINDLKRKNDLQFQQQKKFKNKMFVANSVLKEKLKNEQNKVKSLSIKLQKLQGQVSTLQDDQKELFLENKTLKLKTVDCSKYLEWDYNDVLLWIISLKNDDNNIDYSEYENALKMSLKEEGIRGDTLYIVEMNDIKDWGIKDISHRKNLYSEIQKLTNPNKKNIVNVKPTIKQQRSKNGPCHFGINCKNYINSGHCKYIHTVKDLGLMNKKRGFQPGNGIYFNNDKAKNHDDNEGIAAETAYL